MIVEEINIQDINIKTILESKNLKFVYETKQDYSNRDYLLYDYYEFIKLKMMVCFTEEKVSPDNFEFAIESTNSLKKLLHLIDRCHTSLISANKSFKNEEDFWNYIKGNDENQRLVYYKKRDSFMADLRLINQLQNKFLKEQDINSFDDYINSYNNICIKFNEINERFNVFLEDLNFYVL